MPVYDVECDKCGKQKEIISIHKYIEDGKELCKCGGKFNIVMSNWNSSFELKYNNKTDMVDWSGNKSRYWDAYKAAKARGENVKPMGED